MEHDELPTPDDKAVHLTPDEYRRVDESLESLGEIIPALLANPTSSNIDRLQRIYGVLVLLQERFADTAVVLEDRIYRKLMGAYHTARVQAALGDSEAQRFVDIMRDGLPAHENEASIEEQLWN